MAYLYRVKYQLGDTVVINHSNEEGKIIEFINEQMVIVEVRNVRFPVYMDQIDFPYFKRFSKQTIVPEPKKQKQYVDDVRKEKPRPVERVVDGVQLTVLPVSDTDEFGDEVVHTLKLHLINRTHTSYKFKYQLYFLGEKDFNLSGEVGAFQDFYLHDVDFEHMNDSPSFSFEFSLQQPDKKKEDYFEATVKPKPKQLFARIIEAREKNLASFAYKLFDDYPDKTRQDKENDNWVDMARLAAKGFKVYNARDARQHLEPPRSVIDLHAEKLTDSWASMSSFEILTLQLRTFEKYYELAMAHGQPSLIVVHGMGTGKLRDEIHELLRHRKEVKSFVNQYDARFGYGATEIFFQYK